MLRIVMDSAGDVPEGWLEEYGIDVIPINIHFGEQMYLHGVNLSNSEFYRMLDQENVIPKTSQPTPQQFVDFYNRIARPGDTILSIHVTGKLSGTMASAEIAQRELEGRFRVIPFDSTAGSAAMGFMCRQARLLERAGLALDKIVAELDGIRQRVAVELTLNTLEYARRSGRVKALQAALASLLNVKPIISLRDGVLELGDKVRTRSRSLEFILEAVTKKFGQQIVNASIVHAIDPESARILFDQVKARFNCKELIITELSAAIAANLGPGTVGIVAYPE